MSHKNNHKLRLGIVGAGEVVRRRHLPALERHPDVELVAICNSTYESADKFCREYAPHATPMQNWAELLGMADLDVIWIGTPPYMHSAVTVSALEAGKHVFCQARMAMDLAEAEEMLAVSRRFPELVTMLCPPPYGMLGRKTGSGFYKYEGKQQLPNEAVAGMADPAGEKAGAGSAIPAAAISC